MVENPTDADVVLLAVGESPSAEYFGDASDLSLSGSQTLKGNAAAVAAARESGKPTVAVLISGRPRIVYRAAKALRRWSMHCGGIQLSAAACRLRGRLITLPYRFTPMTETLKEKFCFHSDSGYNQD